MVTLRQIMAGNSPGTTLAMRVGRPLEPQGNLKSRYHRVAASFSKPMIVAFQWTVALPALNSALNVPCPRVLAKRPGQEALLRPRRSLGTKRLRRGPMRDGVRLTGIDDRAMAAIAPM